ncbi:MAG: hypothetical protein ACREB3_07345, partial [Burkholderiales bacterium]
VRGVALAIADGASGEGSGRIAAELAVRTVLRDFYAAPAAWNVSQAIDRVLGSINDWLLAQNSRAVEVEGMVSDGVWEVLGDGPIREILDSGKQPDQIADQLTERSVRSQARYMGRNDATALIAAVDERTA